VTIGVGRARHSWLLVLIVMMFLAGFLEVKGAFLKSELEDGTACLRCHKDDYDKDLNHGLVHQPCVEKKCSVCHCSSAAALAAGSDSQAATVTNVHQDSSGIQPEIKIIDSAIHSALSHSFIFAQDQVADKLRVELWQGANLERVETVVLPPLARLPRLTNKKQAPKISEIRVDRIETGLSSAAVISWKTDVPTTSRIRYGIKNLDRKSRGSKSLTLKHTVELESLKSNRQYRVAVVAVDFFGNRAESDAFMLTTDKDYLAPLHEFSLPRKTDCRIVEMQFYNIGNQYLALLELSQDLSVSIGVEKNSIDRNRVVNEPGVDGEKDLVAVGEAVKSQGKLHDFLVSAEVLTIDNCLHCHKEVRREMSHPVDVLPKRDMHVPDDYTLLPNGRISCMTCHVRHAGDNMFRLVRKQGKEFCSGCHSTY